MCPPSATAPKTAPIGLIPVDSLYSPVRKVSYRVENTREGQILDYDKLTMTIETNGSMTPEDALAFAARILQDQLNIFVNFEEPRREIEAPAPGTAVQPGAAQEGGRARAFGAFGQLPEERQHRLYRRSHSEERSGNAAHAEFRPQVAQRDQGSAGHRWACISAWKCRAGRRRISTISPSASRITTESSFGRPAPETA
jgi:hypothetical protein